MNQLEMANTPLGVFAGCAATGAMMSGEEVDLRSLDLEIKVDGKPVDPRRVVAMWAKTPQAAPPQVEAAPEENRHEVRNGYREVAEHDLESMLLELRHAVSTAANLVIRESEIKARARVAVGNMFSDYDLGTAAQEYMSRDLEDFTPVGAATSTPAQLVVYLRELAERLAGMQ